MDIFIDRIRVRNFRSLKNVEVSLLPITVLVGTNNSGKTSFLRAITLALNAADRRYINQDDLYIDSQGTVLPEKERIITIDLRFIPANNVIEFTTDWINKFGDAINHFPTGKAFYAFRTTIDFSLSNQDPVIKRHVILDWDRELINVQQNHTPPFSFTPAYFIDAQRDLLEDLKNSSSYVGRLVKQIQYDQDSLKEIEELINSLNTKTVEESDVLKHLKQYLEELNRAIQTRGRGVEITPFPQKVRDLHKGMKVSFQDGASDSFNLEYHGMGTRSWASLLTLKAYIAWGAVQKNKDEEPYFPLLALEEPEAHLHPNAQRYVYRQLDEIPGQKIISTHSPFIAGQAKIEELRYFKKEQAETEIRLVDTSKLNPEELRKIQRMVINTRGEILFSKIAVFAEGETEEQILPIFGEKYWGRAPYEMGITFVGCSGTNYKPFLNLTHSLGLNWCIFSDYDNDNVRGQVNAALKDIGINDPTQLSNIILLNEKIEQHLIHEGYQNELKNALIFIKTPQYVNDRHRKAKEPEFEQEKARINALLDDSLLGELIGVKTEVSPIYAENIVSMQDGTRIIPRKIRDLFKWIDTIIS